MHAERFIECFSSNYLVKIVSIFLRGTRRMCVHFGHFSLNDDAVTSPSHGKARQQRPLGLHHKIAQECRFVSTKK